MIAASLALAPARPPRSAIIGRAAVRALYTELALSPTLGLDAACLKKGTRLRTNERQPLGPAAMEQIGVVEFGHQREQGLHQGRLHAASRKRVHERRKGEVEQHGKSSGRLVAHAACSVSAHCFGAMAGACSRSRAHDRRSPAAGDAAAERIARRTTVPRR